MLLRSPHPKQFLRWVSERNGHALETRPDNNWEHRPCPLSLSQNALLRTTETLGNEAQTTNATAGNY
eukprot:5457121-Pyramimonas_sp.AAC.1